MNTFDEVTAELVAFRDARGWAKHHTPKHLSAALAIEAAELQETMLWYDTLPRDKWEHACQETADVLIYALLMCYELGVTPDSLIRRKLAMNAEKYPVGAPRATIEALNEPVDTGEEQP